MRAQIAIAVVVLLAGCSAVAQPNSLEVGEKYTVTFHFEGECPPGTQFQISPVTDRPETPIQNNSTFLRFYVNEVVSNEHGVQHEVVAGRAYDLILIRPGMENSSMVWTATTKEVLFRNPDRECAFPDDTQLTDL